MTTYVELVINFNLYSEKNQVVVSNSKSPICNELARSNLELQAVNLGKEKGIPFNSCWKQLLLERFLSRLGRSAYANKLIFKGGFLLAYMMRIGRETVDLDFLLTRMKTEKETLEEICKEMVPALKGPEHFLQK